ncbi:hypothetical protein HPB51_017402 [Rhipicephalus microplus]|uniref:Uncharacterized protein n=1 Tax=Rhipicephalus microplus TaxID=6941 RepID=A0A9J6DAS0_RHIMP|nr:hypothetical protein HPB51_017402 [Rhipicephalus microplus]
MARATLKSAGTQLYAVSHYNDIYEQFNGLAKWLKGYHVSQEGAQPPIRVTQSTTGRAHFRRSAAADFRRTGRGQLPPRRGGEARTRAPALSLSSSFPNLKKAAVRRYVIGFAPGKALGVPARRCSPNATVPPLLGNERTSILGNGDNESRDWGTAGNFGAASGNEAVCSEKRVEWKGNAAKAAALAAHSREPVLQGQAERRGEGSEQSAFPSPSSFKVTHCLKEEARFSESLAEEENFLSRTSALFTLGRAAAAASLLLCVCAADVVDNAINAPNHPFGSAVAVE